MIPDMQSEASRCTNVARDTVRGFQEAYSCSHSCFQRLPDLDASRRLTNAPRDASRGVKYANKCCQRYAPSDVYMTLTNAPEML